MRELSRRGVDPCIDLETDSRTGGFAQHAILIRSGGLVRVGNVQCAVALRWRVCFYLRRVPRDPRASTALVCMGISMRIKSTDSEGARMARVRGAIRVRGCRGAYFA